MIKPLADRVLVEPQEAQTKTASGIFIPDTAKEKPQQGTVLAAGPGKKDEPMEVKSANGWRSRTSRTPPKTLTQGEWVADYKGSRMKGMLRHDCCSR